MPYSFRELLSKNVTTVFLLWTVDMSYAELEYCGMIDAFVGDKNKPNYFGYYIYVLVDKRKSVRFNEKKFQSDSLVDSYNYGQNFIVYRYKVPRQFEDDFDVITSNKYSTVSDDFKTKFPKQQQAIDFNTHRHYTQNDKAFKIISRFSYFKEDFEKYLDEEIPENIEWWKIFSIEREILDILKYI